MTYIPAQTFTTDVYGDIAVVYGGASADAFGRGRIAEPQTLFSVSFKYDLNPLIIQTANVGTGNVAKTANISSVTLSTGGTGANASATLQSHGYYRYEPGKSQAVAMTGVIGAYTQYVRKQIGYFDDYDGIFFDMDGRTTGVNNGNAAGNIAVTLRSSTTGVPIDTQTIQSNWNIDKMDGTGPSGVTLDFTKTQIFFMDLQWLGVGRVRFGFDVDGVFYYCHQILNANHLTVPYMNTGSLPIRWAITNDTSSPSGTNTMSAVCGTIISEGGSQAPQSLIFSVNNGITGISVGHAAYIPIISISPSLTFQGNPNRVIYKLLSGNMMNTSSPICEWVLIYNGTLSGASFANVNTGISGMRYDVTANAISGGTVVASGYIQGDVAGGQIYLPDLSSLEIPFTINIAGVVADVYTLCAEALSSTATITGSLTWSEDR
jgi:hypothetical protein